MKIEEIICETKEISNLFFSGRQKVVKDEGAEAEESSRNVGRSPIDPNR